MSKLWLGKVDLWYTAEMVDLSKFSVENLTDNDYQAWKSKMKMLLIQAGTWSYVQEAKPEELSNARNAGDEQARSMICLSFEDSQIVPLSNYGTAKEMWDRLEKGIRKVQFE